MPDITRVILTDWCVVWQRSDTKDKYGRARVSAPIEVKCRWSEQDQVGVTQDNTTEHYPRSIPVSQEIALGSYVWGNGKIADLPSSPVYFEVVGRSKTPDIKGRHPAYSIVLQKASKTLPELV